MTDTAALREQLETRLKELTVRVAEEAEQLRAPHSASFDEQALEREGEEVVEDLEEAHLAEIAAIRAALARMDAGTYGECESCGKTIAPARLKAVPQAAFCIDCASEQEKAAR